GKIHYLKQKQTAGKATERPLCNAGECSLQRYIFESIISADGPGQPGQTHKPVNEPATPIVGTQMSQIRFLSKYQ
ncbi:MAG TPA: hypothetical protein VF421_17750, partial [Niabella sp.]